MWAKLTGKLAGAALTGKALWAVVGLVLAGVSWAIFSFFHIASLNQKLGECSGFEATAAQANEVSIRLAERVSECVNQAALDLEAERRANALLEHRIERITAEANRERTERNQIYETDDECAAWRTGLVCAALSERLRESAAKLAGDYRSADTGDAEDTR